jgi:hypothetical protein
MFGESSSKSRRSSRWVVLVAVALGATLSCRGSESQAKAAEPAAKAAPAAEPAAKATAPAAKPAPVAPSTGKELAPPPTMSKAEADKRIAAALTEFGKPKHGDCELVVERLRSALPVAIGSAHKLDAALIPAAQAITLCAMHNKQWQTLLVWTYILLDTDPSQARPAYVPRALIGLGRFKEAATELLRLNKLHPKDIQLASTGVLLVCELKQWDKCAKLSDALRNEADRDTSEHKEKMLGLAHALKALALLHLGRLDEANREAEAAESKDGEGRLSDRMHRMTAAAQLSSLVVDPVIQPNLALGIYHLYGSKPGAVAGAPVRLELYNIDKKLDRQVRIEAEVPGITEKTTRSIVLLHGKMDAVALVPPLKVGLDVAAVRGQRQAEWQIKITDVSGASERVVFEQSFPIAVLPRDTLPTKKRVSNDSSEPAYYFIGAWVTPNARAVDAFLADAKKRAPGGSFAGEQAPTVPQVKAIYDELQARGVSYVMDPEIGADIGVVQRTRLPTEVLASTNAQCLEGAILFATMLEAIGLRPILVVVPGHAFVGWFGAAKDGAHPGDAMYVETTMVHSASFADAVLKGRAEIAEHAADFKRGTAMKMPVAELRKMGVSPQPGD